MDPHDGRIDHLDGGIVSCSKRSHELAPYASPPPANEAIIGGSIWAQSSGQVAPRCARAQDPEDAIEDTAVINPPYAARLIWQQRLDGEPFAVGECIAHESSFSWRLESLSSRRRR